MTEYTVIGTDVSFHQDDPNTIRQIDFEKMKSAGAEFVIIRSGQNTWIDSDFIYNWKAAKDAGLARGAYWFFDSRSSPTQQAELWSAAVGSDLPECGVWMDFEESYGGAHSGEKYFKDFAAHVKTEFPKSLVGVYTGYYYWIERVKDTGFWSEYPLWLAQYGTTAPKAPPPWSPDKWKLWQFTDRGDGDKYGAESSRIDLNYFNGDTEALRKFFNLTGGITPPPTDSPTGGTMRYEAISTKYNMTLRPDHNTFEYFSPNVSVPKNTQMNGDELWIAPADGSEVKKDDKWLKTTYAGKVGWVAIIHKGYEYCSLVDNGATTPPDETTPPAGTPLPATIESTQVLKDDAGVVLATYKGTLAKQ